MSMYKCPHCNEWMGYEQNHHVCPALVARAAGLQNALTTLTLERDQDHSVLQDRVAELEGNLRAALADNDRISGLLSVEVNRVAELQDSFEAQQEVALDRASKAEGRVKELETLGRNAIRRDIYDAAMTRMAELRQQIATPMLAKVMNERDAAQDRVIELEADKQAMVDDRRRIEDASKCPGDVDLLDHVELQAGRVKDLESTVTERTMQFQGVLVAIEGGHESIRRLIDTEYAEFKTSDYQE